MVCEISSSRNNVCAKIRFFLQKNKFFWTIFNRYNILRSSKIFGGVSILLNLNCILMPSTCRLSKASTICSSASVSSEERWCPKISLKPANIAKLRTTKTEYNATFLKEKPRQKRWANSQTNPMIVELFLQPFQSLFQRFLCFVPIVHH